MRERERDRRGQHCMELVSVTIPMLGYHSRVPTGSLDFCSNPGLIHAPAPQNAFAYGRRTWSHDQVEDQDGVPVSWIWQCTGPTHCDHQGVQKEDILNSLPLSLRFPPQICMSIYIYILTKKKRGNRNGNYLDLSNIHNFRETSHYALYKNLNTHTFVTQLSIKH